MKCLVVMRCFHFARAAILARVAGSGKNVVALFGFRRGGFRIWPQCVERLRENRSLRHCREFGCKWFHKFISRLGNGVRGRFALRLVVKSMNPGEIAFRDQFRLRLQPVLHLMTGRGALVYIAKVGFSGDFIRRRHKIYFVLV